jgi:hypothetical protein
MGKDTTYKIRIGDPAGDKLTYDTGGLKVVSNTISINPGITIAVPPTANNVDYGYRFASAFSGTNYIGTFAAEPTSAIRSIELLNSATASSKTTQVFLTAASGAVQAQMLLQSDGTTAIIQAYTTVQPSANNAISLGTASLKWKDLFVAGAVNFTNLGGSGNRTMCVDNAGAVYTVASGAAC